MALVRTSGKRILLAGAARIALAAAGVVGGGGGGGGLPEGVIGATEIVGTGAGAGAIAIIGMAAEAGQLTEGDAVFLRRTDTGAALSTQWAYAAPYPDASGAPTTGVRTVHLAVETPALADGVALPIELVRGTHSAGTALDVATLTSGRTATVSILPDPAYSGGATQVFDVIAGRHSTERWMEGKNCTVIPARVAVNASAVGGATSARLECWLWVTKDGALRVRGGLYNDATGKAGGGSVRCQIEVRIDGELLFQSTLKTLLQYGRYLFDETKKAGVAGSFSRPVVKPDEPRLVAAGLNLPYDTSAPFNAGSLVANINTEAVTNKADPYWNASLNRNAGGTGGRNEIGFRTACVALWLRGGMDARRATLWQARAAATRQTSYWHEGLNKPINSEDFPRFTSEVQWQGANQSPAGTSPALMNGVVPDQQISANTTDHITADHAHNGSFFALPALLECDPVLYGMVEMQSAWSVTDHNTRYNGTTVDFNEEPHWRATTADAATGRNIATVVGAEQTRGIGWDFRLRADAAALLPKAWPNRGLYERIMRGTLAYWGSNASTWTTRYGEMGWPIPHYEGRHVPGFMFGYALISAIYALRTGWAGTHGVAAVREFSRFLAGGMMRDDLWRNFAESTDIPVATGYRTGFYTTYDQVYADINGYGGIVPPDWGANVQDYGDWEMNVVATLLLIMDTPEVGLTVRANAADGLVRFWSERRSNNVIVPGRYEKNPRTEPARFFSENFQTNALTARGMTHSQSSAPVIPVGQTFEVSKDAPASSVVGLIRTTGAMPRASSETAHDAWVLTTQSASGRFSISRGGVIRVATANPPAGSYTVSAYTRTYDDAGTEYRSSTVSVAITSA